MQEELVPPDLGPSPSRVALALRQAPSTRLTKDSGYSPQIRLPRIYGDNGAEMLELMHRRTRGNSSVVQRLSPEGQGMACRPGPFEPPLEGAGRTEPLQESD
jgi:hypothetical protein